jgi:hypothetical protein
MERVELTVRGERASETPSALADVARDHREDYAGEDFAVIVTERLYYRTLDSVQATTIFDLVEETTCEVTVVVGGGKGGLARSDVGAEADEARKIRREIESLCGTLDLRVEER